MYAQRIEEVDDHRIQEVDEHRIAMAKISNATLVPDSEECQPSSSTYPWSQGIIFPTKQAEKEGGESSDNHSEDQSEKDHEGEDRCWLAPPIKSIYPSATEKANPKSMIIETAQHESFIKMVQKGEDPCQRANFQFLSTFLFTFALPTPQFYCGPHALFVVLLSSCLDSPLFC